MKRSNLALLETWKQPPISPDELDRRLKVCRAKGREAQRKYIAKKKAKKALESA